MDIRVASIYNAYGEYKVKNASGARKAEHDGKAESFKDTFSLSAQAEDYQLARKALAGVPEIRTGLVNQIKAKVDSGAYRVKPEDVAAKILAGYTA